MYREWLIKILPVIFQMSRLRNSDQHHVGQNYRHQYVSNNNK